MKIENLSMYGQLFESASVVVDKAAPAGPRTLYPTIDGEREEFEQFFELIGAKKISYRLFVFIYPNMVNVVRNYIRAREETMDLQSVVLTEPEIRMLFREELPRLFREAIRRTSSEVDSSEETQEAYFLLQRVLEIIERYAEQMYLLFKGAVRDAQLQHEIERVHKKTQDALS